MNPEYYSLWAKISYDKLFDSISDFDGKIGLPPLQLPLNIAEGLPVIKLCGLQVSECFFLSEPNGQL